MHREITAFDRSDLCPVYFPYPWSDPDFLSSPANMQGVGPASRGRQSWLLPSLCSPARRAPRLARPNCRERTAAMHCNDAPPLRQRGRVVTARSAAVHRGRQIVTGGGNQPTKIKSNGNNGGLETNIFSHFVFGLLKTQKKK